MSLNTTKLWIVATPLGNPGDLSPRARHILGSVDFILAEDTRRSGLLLCQCDIVAKRFISFHEHNETDKLPGILEELHSGKSAALISDAGTPLVSDPGYRLVRACRDAGIAVSPVPGPSAPLAALSASGMPPHPFAFLGFAPRKSSDQEQFFAPYANLGMTLIFFDRKDRLVDTLASAHAALGKRDVCIARELTKTYEEFIYCTLGETVPFTELLGEITVIIGPPDRNNRADPQVILDYMDTNPFTQEKPKDAARRIAELFPGWNGKEIYALMQKRLQ